MKVKILTFAVAAALLCCLSGCNAAPPPPPAPVSLALTDTAGTEVAATLTLFKGESASLSALPSEQVAGTLTAECSGSMAKVDVNGMDVTLTALDKGEAEVVLTFTPEDPNRPVTHQTVSIKVALATQEFSVTPADLPQIIVLETLEDIVAKHTAQSDSLAALEEEAEEVEVLPVPTSVLIPSDDEDVADIPYPYTYENGTLSIVCNGVAALELVTEEGATISPPLSNNYASLYVEDNLLLVQANQPGETEILITSEKENCEPATFALKLKVALPPIDLKLVGSQLDSSNIELEPGKSYTITLDAPAETVFTAQANSPTIKAVVQGNTLVVTGVSKGKTTIDLLGELEGYEPIEKTITIQVTPTQAKLALTSPLLKNGKVNLLDEASTVIVAAISPSATLSYTGGNGVVEVVRTQNSFTVRALKAGTATLTFTAEEAGLYRNAQTISVTVSQPTLQLTTDVSILRGSAGQTLSATYATTPPDATVTATSSNSSVGTVTCADGRVTIKALKNGTATITLTAKKTGFATVTRNIVLNIGDQRMTLSTNPSSINAAAGNTTIKIICSLPDATFSVTATGSVSVDQPKGNTFAVRPTGAGTITVKASRGGYTPTQCTITVHPKTAKTISLSASPSVINAEDGNTTVRISCNPSDATLSVTTSGSVSADQPKGNTFAVRPTGAGTITVKATKSGYATAQYTISVLPKPVKVDTSGFADEVFRLTNIERKNHGLPALSRISEIDRGAQIRAGEIGSKFSHDRPNGGSFYTVLGVEEGKNYTYGENIASGYGTPQAVVTGWMNSPGHRANILNKDYSGIGIGVSGRQWVQIFSNERTTTPTPPATDTSGYANEVVRLVNIERRNNGGLPPLEHMSHLKTAAQIRAAELIIKFSHTRPNGQSWSTLITNDGYSTHGENIADGQRTPQEVVTSWMNSPGHRANILNKDYTGIGVGYDQNRWVQLFAGGSMTPSVTACQTCSGCTVTGSHSCNGNRETCPCACTACEPLVEKPFVCTKCNGCTNTDKNHTCNGNRETCPCSCTMCEPLIEKPFVCTKCNGCTNTDKNHTCNGNRETCPCACASCEPLPTEKPFVCTTCSGCTNTDKAHSCNGNRDSCPCSCTACEPLPKEPEPKPEPEPEPEPKPEPPPEPEPTPEPEPPAPAPPSDSDVLATGCLRSAMPHALGLADG